MFKYSIRKLTPNAFNYLEYYLRYVVYNFAVLILCTCVHDRYMQRLKVYRVQHWLNDSGREVTDEGKAVPQEVNLRRLILLIKPVSRSINIVEINSMYIGTGLCHC